MNKVAQIKYLFALAVAMGSVAAQAQLAGVLPPGSQLAGTMPKLNPQTGLPYPTGSYQSFWPGFRPISNVPVLLTGTGPATSRAMTYVVATRNEWERLYRELNPPLPGEQVYAPAFTDFSDEVIVVVRLSATNDLDVVPTIDSIERLDGVTSLVRYSIWTPFRGTPRGDNQPRTISIGDAVKEANRDRMPSADRERSDKDRKKDDAGSPMRLSTRSFSPYVVVKAPRTSGWFRFSGSVQNYRPWRPGRGD